MFRPEFLNRVDDIIVFRHLTIDDLKQVIDIELTKVRERLGERGLKLILTDAAKKFLIKKGSNTDFGAGRCAGRSRISSRIRSPRNCSRANSKARTDHGRRQGSRRQEAVDLRGQRSASRPSTPSAPPAAMPEPESHRE